MRSRNHCLPKLPSRLLCHHFISLYHGIVVVTGIYRPSLCAILEDDIVPVEGLSQGELLITERGQEQRHPLSIVVLAGTHNRSMQMNFPSAVRPSASVQMIQQPKSFSTSVLLCWSIGVHPLAAALIFPLVVNVCSLSVCLYVFCVVREECSCPLLVCYAALLAPVLTVKDDFLFCSGTRSSSSSVVVEAATFFKRGPRTTHRFPITGVAGCRKVSQGVARCRISSEGVILVVFFVSLGSFWGPRPRHPSRNVVVVHTISTLGTLGTRITTSNDQ
jgi:hypothetical protein